MKTISFPKLLAVAAILSLSQQAKAQPGIFKELLIDDGAGHKVHIAPPAGLTNSSPINWTLPLPASGNPAPGFVQAGDATNAYLQWDDINKYWKAVATGGVLNGGIANTIPKWSDATTLTNSLLQDDGATVSINNGVLLAMGATGATPTSGNSTRMMWVPAKGAFRAGTIDGDQYDGTTNYWDDVNLGNYSAAFGLDTKASGNYSTASGFVSEASGTSSVAIGQFVTASGVASVALGHNSIASSDGATTMGWACRAAGKYSVGIGYHAFATGDNSVALGAYANSNFKTGCFLFGDGSTATTSSISVKNTANDQFMVRAAGGTVFYSNSGASIGVEIVPNGNSWSSVSDSNKKENRVLANGEAVLNKIGTMWLGSWNYKGQDPKLYRHYGPMAQEFYAAFGNDGVGISGNDTTLASADVDGINMIAIQALEKRTATLQAENEALRTQLKTETSALRKELEEMKQAVVTLTNAQKKNSAVEASLK